MTTEELVERQLRHLEKLDEDLIRRRELDDAHLSLGRGVAELHRLRNEILREILLELRRLRVTT